MKKMIKKVGIISIIMGILIPFISVPEVKAAESCTKHLQNYLFMEKINTAADLILYEDGTTNGSLFPYVFADPDLNDIRIISVEVDSFEDSNKALENYWEQFEDIMDHIDDNYGKVTTEIKKDGYPLIYDKDVTNSKYAKTEYSTNTLLLHGRWTNEDDETAKAQWQNVDADDGKEQSIQSVFTNFDEMIGTYDNTDDGSIYVEFGEVKSGDVKSTRESVTVDKLNDAIKNASYKYEEDGKIFLPLAITREFTNDAEDKLNDLIFGYYDSAKKAYGIFTTDIHPNDATVTDTVVDSYTAFKDYLDAIKDIPEDEDDRTAQDKETLKNAGLQYVSWETGKNVSDIDVRTDAEFEVMYWPVVLNVEYESCTRTTENWTLTYNGNVPDNSVANLPQSQTATVGSAITVDNSKPEREGYVFKTWCENPDGSGVCKNPGDSITSDTSTTVTLYAQWGKDDTEENKKSGIVSYVIGFMSVGLLASGVYLISKKKNLFKQI